MSDKMLKDGWRGLLAAREDDRTELSYRRFVAGYFVILFSVIALSVCGKLLFGVSAYRSIFVLCGVLFTLAGAGVPRQLYLTIRMVRWFSLIRDPRIMRGLLFLLGAALALVGIFGSDAQRAG